MTSQRKLASAYMQFAKRETAARYNLASSGIADCDVGDLYLGAADLALHGDNSYGWPPLGEAIATRYGVDPACVVIPGGGCSFANHLAIAAILDPGDGVLLELPNYELLLSTLAYFQARIGYLPRRADCGWRLDLDEVAAKVDAGARLVVITNLHNPSSAAMTVEEVAAVARAAGDALVLVDEVYLESTFHDRLLAWTSFPRSGGKHHCHQQPHQGLRAIWLEMRLDPGPEGIGGTHATPE